MVSVIDCPALTGTLQVTSCPVTSTVPGPVAVTTGVTLGTAGVAICGWLTAQKLLYAASLANRPLLFLGIVLILVGMQFASLGLMADVLARTYYEAQNKTPYYIRSCTCQGKSLQMRSCSRGEHPSRHNECEKCGSSTS